MLRTPVDLPEEAAAFYQSDYSQDTTTEVPSADELAALVASNFDGTERSHDRYLALIDALSVPRTANLVDFGCS